MDVQGVSDQWIMQVGLDDTTTLSLSPSLRPPRYAPRSQPRVVRCRYKAAQQMRPPLRQKNLVEGILLLER
jgi:hypothetical protein